MMMGLMEAEHVALSFKESALCLAMNSNKWELMTTTGAAAPAVLLLLHVL
jgi:hypothetical protein